MTTNVTLRMDEELLRKLQHRAADQDLTLSAWIVSVLTREIDDSEFDKARAQASEQLDNPFRLGGRPLTRDEAHAR